MRHRCHSRFRLDEYKGSAAHIKLKNPPAKGLSPTGSRRWTVGKTIRRTNAIGIDELLD
jgi:hypothetical protein